MKKRESPYHGFLLIDKPPGATSFDLVRAVKHALGTGAVGHAGTLDPLATGLLVVAVGRATKLIRFVQDARKTYTARVVFHAMSESDDAEGPILPVENPPVITESALRDALASLVGAHDQRPPAHSAKRIDGKRAYDLARAGEEPEMKPCRVTAHALNLQEANPTAATSGENQGVFEAIIQCEVGSGYYVRSMARDLGERLGTAAHLGGLRRETIGRFDVRDALSAVDLGWTVAPPEKSDAAPVQLTEEEKKARRAPVLKSLLSPYIALAGFPSYTATDNETTRLLQGKILDVDTSRVLPAEDNARSNLLVIRDADGPCLLAGYPSKGNGAKIEVNLFPLREALSRSRP